MRRLFGRSSVPRDATGGSGITLRNSWSVAATFLVSLSLVACSSARSGGNEKPPPTSKRSPDASVDATPPQVTTNDETIVSPSSNAPTSGAPGPGCAPFAAATFTIIQTELDRLAPVNLDAFIANDETGQLSDDYYRRTRDVEAAAVAAGCDRVSLARRVLEGGEGLRVNGPVAGAAKAGIVDELAWRITRSRQNDDTAPTTVAFPEVTLVNPSLLKTCADVGAGWLPVYQAMIDALAAVPLDSYLSGDIVRSTDVREAGTTDLGSVRFAGETIERSVDALVAASDELSCSEDEIARVLVNRSAELRATSAAGIVFAADQLDLALLLITGV